MNTRHAWKPRRSVSVVILAPRKVDTCAMVSIKLKRLRNAINFKNFINWYKMGSQQTWRQIYSQTSDCQPAEVTDYPVVYMTEAYTDIRRNNMPKQGPDLMHNRPVRKPIDPKVSLWWGIKPEDRKENTILNMSRLNRITFLTSGPRLNIKTVLSTYGDFHVKDKTAVRTSYL